MLMTPRGMTAEGGDLRVDVMGGERGIDAGEVPDQHALKPPFPLRAIDFVSRIFAPGATNPFDLLEQCPEIRPINLPFGIQIISFERDPGRRVALDPSDFEVQPAE